MAIVKNYELLAEEHRDTDLFDYASPAKSLRTRLHNKPSVALIALIGPYGIGKSVLLNEVSKHLSKQQTDWFHFDAWKYPDRQNLWEGFILDFAQQFDKKTFKEMEQKIDGEYGKKKIGLIKTLATAIKIGGNAHTPGLGTAAGSTVDKFSFLYSSNPIKRLHGYEKLLNDLVSKSKKDLYIVLEDLDRSKEAGLQFLETVSHFFRNKEFKRKIRIIVPVSDKELDDYEKKASYIKAVDYFEYFNAKNLDVSSFMENVLDDELLSNPKTHSQIKALFEYSLNSGHINIRTLKHIVRSADNRFNNLVEKKFKANEVICLVIETMRYLPPSSGSGKSMYEQSAGQKNIRDGIPNTVLWSLARNEPVHETLDFFNAHRINQNHKTISFTNDGDFRVIDATVSYNGAIPQGSSINLNAVLPDIYFVED